MEEFKISPIATFRSPLKHFLEAPRQATHNIPHCYIEMASDPNLKLGLKDLDGFERIWVIFAFHRKDTWRPLVHPPRGSEEKRGVFATRSPLRPNHLGLSCLEITRIEEEKIFVKGGDLLDGTPIFDIKPYLPYCDSFSESKIGWLEGSDKHRWRLHWSPEATRQKLWLANQNIHVETVAENQLEFDPTNAERKRVYPENQDWVFAYRTWRLGFSLDASEQKIEIQKIWSGYSPEVLKSHEDPYGDKEIHRQFVELFN